ncbi:MAG: hypothetical protein EOP50_12605, partial [Sphingobacteriales bacterium]
MVSSESLILPMTNTLLTKPSLLAFAAFLTLAATSCKKAEVAAPESETTVAATTSSEIDQLTAFLRSSTGEDNITFNAATQNFVIAGDAEMSLSDARQHQAAGQGAQTEHRKSYYSVARNKANVIKVYVDGTVPAVWRTAVDKAIANWNASGSYLYISKSTTYAAGMLKVTAVNNGATGVIATTYYPDYSGSVGKSCTINTNYNYLSAGLQVFAITHELGHAFGFGHTNSTYGTLIPGTPNTDGNSIMNSVCL